jgi:hypothetical protein
MHFTIKELEDYISNMEAGIWMALEDWSHNNLLEAMADLRITKNVISKFKEDKQRLQANK